MLKVQIQGILLHMLSNWTNYIVKARSSMQYAVCSMQYAVTSYRDDEILIR